MWLCDSGHSSEVSVDVDILLASFWLPGLAVQLNEGLCFVVQDCEISLWCFAIRCIVPATNYIHAHLDQLGEILLEILRKIIACQLALLKLFTTARKSGQF